MSRISRRKLMMSASTLPIFVSSLAGGSKVERKAGRPSSILAKVDYWIAADARLTGLQLRWQELETHLFAEAGRRDMSCESAMRSSLPAAVQMRSLDEEVIAAREQLERLADEIRQTPARTFREAIAKMELGLAIQGPYDWRDHALELLADGMAELRALLEAERGVDPSSFR